MRELCSAVLKEIILRNHLEILTMKTRRINSLNLGLEH